MRDRIAWAFASIAPCVSTQPLGSDVLPEVNCRTAQSAGCGGIWRTSHGLPAASSSGVIVRAAAGTDSGAPRAGRTITRGWLAAQILDRTSSLVSSRTCLAAAEHGTATAPRTWIAQNAATK